MTDKDDIFCVEARGDKTEESGYGKTRWKIMIIDDEEDVHEVTKMALNNFSFNNKGLEFISAYSGKEAEQLIDANPDTSLMFVDVVMESDDAGLRFIKCVRDRLDNNIVRIILRTGQPGHAPEKEVIRNYDINDYKEKDELTAQKLFTVVISSLRSYEHISTIEDNKKEISKLYDDLKKYNENLERKVDTFSKFVPRQFLECLEIEHFEDIQPEQARQMQLSILFSDIRGFSNLSEKLTPQEEFKFLNRYFTLMSGPIEEHQGFIDKFLGDGIMALFHCSAIDAVNAAIQMHRKLDGYNMKQQNVNTSPVEIGIGVNTGDLILGTVGSDKRIDSTVIGDAVNLASRIESLTKYYNVRILISEFTYLALKDPDQYHIREIDHVRVYGKGKPIKIYEAFDGDGSHSIRQKLKLLPIYMKGIAFYKSQDWKQASEAMLECLTILPDDKVSRIYLERCWEFQKNPPPADWDGAILLNKM